MVEINTKISKMAFGLNREEKLWEDAPTRG